MSADATTVVSSPGEATHVAVVDGDVSVVAVESGENTVVRELAVGVEGPAGTQGAPGVVAADAPVAYDSGTQTVALDYGDGLDIDTDTLVVDATVLRTDRDAIIGVGVDPGRLLAIDVPAGTGAVGQFGLADLADPDPVRAVLYYADGGAGAVLLADAAVTALASIFCEDDGVNGVRLRVDRFLVGPMRVSGADGIENDDYATVGQVLSALSFIDGGAP